MKASSPTVPPPTNGFNRRSFLHSLGLGTGAAMLPGLLTGGATPAHADVTSDIAILNFALNFEYLEAEYYTRGTTGMGLDDFKIPVDGKGTPGAVTIKSNPLVPFTDSNILGYANEIAEDERLHVQFVRNTIISLGGTPVARPSSDYLNSFNLLAVNAGIASSFDPFASQENFLLGGFVFSDVTLTALVGAAGLITLPVVKAGSSGILGVEGYHDGVLRYNLFKLGSYTQGVVQKISELRDTLDGKRDLDQGVVNADGTPNIVPADANSVAFGRSMRKVLNIAYGARGASSGLFFPAGANS